MVLHPSSAISQLASKIVFIANGLGVLVVQHPDQIISGLLHSILQYSFGGWFFVSSSAWFFHQRINNFRHGEHCFPPQILLFYCTLVPHLIPALCEEACRAWYILGTTSAGCG